MPKSSGQGENPKQTAPLRGKPAKGVSAVLLALVLGLVAYALRAYDIGAADISFDEDLNLAAVQKPFGEVLPFVTPRPPLAFVAQWIAVRATGRHDITVLRQTSAFEGALAVLVLFGFAYRLGGMPLAALAGLLLCFSHFHFVYCRIARYYPMLTLTCIAFLWCYWEGLTRQRLMLLAGLFPLALLVAWSHQSGNLFLTACVFALPVFVLSRGWWALAKSAPKLAGCVLAGAAVAAGVFAYALRAELARTLRVIAASSEADKLTAYFDIAPAFLLGRLDDYTGVPMPYIWGVAALIGLGLLYLVVRKPRLAVLLVSTLVVPFALIYVLRPQNQWRAKYFILSLIHI